VLRGADGVDRAGTQLVTGWEESGSITVATRPADPTQEWPTELVGAGLSGIEDARLADFDGDNVPDVVACSDSGQRCYLAFGGGPTVTLTASMGHGRAMQAAAADVNADGRLDVVFGTRAGTAANPAVIAVLHNPGATARDGTAWTYQQISIAGWTMSVHALDFDGDADVDVVVSDRSSYKDAAGVARWDLYGARWIEQTATGWANHAISPPAGGCAECTPGDEMFLRVVDWDGDGDWDVVDGTSTATKPNRIAIRTNNGDGTWSQELVPAFAGTGHYQGVDVGDIDGDGRKDLVVSTWEVNALPASPLIGVYVLLNLGPGQWAFEDVSGPEGSKWDNPLLWDVDDNGYLDIVNSEQVENLGVLWWSNWRVP
jgi:hypothetical protein